MRKLKLQMQLSIDGFVAGPNGEMDWMVWNWDEHLKQYVTDITEPVDTIILGRVLAEGFIPHWASAAISPETAEPGAQKMNETAKVVFSKTLQSHDWKNTRLATGNLAEEINALKKQDGNDIIAYGGGSFVSNLIKEGLIDDYYLFINPSILGSGMPIFQEVHTRSNLKIIKSQSFPCGITALHYQTT
jgi:dihydrofolate reductase